MRIAFLSHAYHEVTGSEEFLIDILRRLGTVERYFYRREQGQTGWVEGFKPREFDCVVIFQVYECFQYVNADHPNIVFIPMYDDARIWEEPAYRREIFDSTKTLCFSSTLYRELAVRNPVSAHFQYYPDPQLYPQAQDYGAPRGYYWRRTNEIDHQVIKRLTAGFAFERFTLHDVPDPGVSNKDEVNGPLVNTAHYTVTSWFPSEESHLHNLSQHNIYFAPRLREGIGFGFLKAMSMGLCVVAPNTATHNEYIAQGCTGVLYRPDKPDAVDLRRYRERGCRARDSMERGRRRWEARSEELLEFFAIPRNAFQRRQFVVGSWLEESHGTAPAEKSNVSARLPSVAVVTVCLNAREDIEKTIRSVAAQDYPGLDHVIFDGGSTDGTVDVIRKYERALAFWKSCPDGGAYPARQLSLNQVKSDWVLFMNAGDFFFSADALSRVFADVPRTAGVVYGHRIHRNAAGADELHFAADFEFSWSRLQAGEFDFECFAGFPGLQATAIRTRLLRELQFDPLFRFAAGHEWLARAWRCGVEFFHADEIISVYLGDRLSGGRFERCKQEWCAIALRYGLRKAALRFRTRAHADIRGAIDLEFGNRSDRFAERFVDTAVGRTLSRMPGAGALAKTAAMLYVSVAKVFYFQFPGHREFLQFRKGGSVPTYLSEARGLAEPEDWGVWSEGKRVELVFRRWLPAAFTLILHARAFGPNASAAIPVTVGGITRQMAMKGKRRKKYQLDFSGHGDDSTIMTFSIPYPVAPAELSPGTSSDRRQLGLGFVSMRIEPKGRTAFSRLFGFASTGSTPQIAASSTAPGAPPDPT